MSYIHTLLYLSSMAVIMVHRGQQKWRAFMKCRYLLNYFLRES